MDSKDSCFILGFILGIILSACLSTSFCCSIWRSSAIERGVARYHPVTGAWEWTVPKAEDKGSDGI